MRFRDKVGITSNHVHDESDGDRRQYDDFEDAISYVSSDNNRAEGTQQRVHSYDYIDESQVRIGGFATIQVHGQITTDIITNMRGKFGNSSQVSLYYNDQMDGNNCFRAM